MFRGRIVDVLKTSWRRFENVLRTSCRRLEDVLKASTGPFEKVLARRLKDVLKTSWKHMTKTSILVLIKTFPRRLENVFWRHFMKTKTKCVFKTSSSRQMFAGNNINGPYAKLCVPDVVKNLNVKVFNLLSKTIETRHIEWHETC